MSKARWKDTLPESWEPSLTAAVKGLASAIQYSGYNVNEARVWAGYAAADIRAFRKQLGVESQRVEVSIDGMNDEQVLWWAMRNVTLAAIAEHVAADFLRRAEAYLRELWKRGRSDG